MKFTIFAAVAAFASFVAAQSNAITAPIGGAVSAGKPTTITWQPSDQGTITLTLRSGDGNALNTVATIACKSTRVISLLSILPHAQSSTSRRNRHAMMYISRSC